MSAPLLQIEDLHVRVPVEEGVVHAVRGVSLAVERGRVLGIVGESGSGKSMTSLATMRLLPPTAQVSGRVLFDGRDLLTLGREELRRIRGEEIAMIFQDPLSSLHPFQRVGRQVAEAIRVHHPVSRAVARRRAVELLGMVGIPDATRRVDDYPHEFSGGMRQRAMIAMALANEPRLLIADEPTTALDVTVQAQVLKLLRRLGEELGMGLVIITHDLGVVAQTADDVAVMYAGRVVEQATVETLFARPEHPYTWGLLRSMPRIDVRHGGTLAAIPGRPPDPLALPSGCAFHPRCAHACAEHAETDPQPRAVPDDPAHRVACLLEPERRRRLWREQEENA